MNESISSRFDGCLDIEVIRRQITVRPDPVKGLANKDALVAAEILSQALEQIYLPNEFSLSFIMEMSAKSALHSQLLFSSEVNFISRFYNPPDVEVKPVCLTGLAGVGKSQTIAALRKVLPTPIDFECDHFHGKLKLFSHWYVSARGKAGGRQLLADFVGAAGGNAAKLLVECRRRANRDGISLLLLDETQHINTGQGASRVTEMLLTMAAIGPPMIYVSNYSLLHRLQGRNSEDKQRLLSEPRIMLPDDPDSESWRGYIAECIRVAGSCMKGSVDDFSQEIYRSTFGIKRLVVQLLKHAYIAARGAGRACLELADLSKAYQCVAYAANKDDVEELHILALRGRTSRRRLDLRCPFELPASLKSNVVAFVRNDRDTRVINKVFESSLTVGEREVMEEAHPAVTKASRPKVPRKPPLPKSSMDDLERAFLEDLVVTPPPKPKKP
ncbi:transposase [Pseudomonas otitidis]|uniref:transposase n=1 Tax=Metapseudomonas otitidis TaxID=319939 RepID=UPI00244CFA29|nr:transposase [Pseudomonas otitidis]MDH1109816.1 transposase [Pseudomonas otitidis]MDH1161519.1 transposase [Pseudomonas otitidis]MDH1167723.1 transposase [Pseudomonas otitidis]